MKVYIDARWTRTDYYDGISRYTANLTEAFAKIHPVTMLIYNKKQLKLLPKDVPYILVNNPLSPRELLLGHKLNKLGADVVFNPLQTMGSIGKKYKLILTVQDLTYYDHPKPPTFLPGPVRLIWWLFHQAYWPQRLLLKSADSIATVSHTSKKYIKKHRLTNKPIYVIYNAPTAKKYLKPSLDTKKDILYMGSFMPYKNVETLIEGMANLPDYTLHLLTKISPSRKAKLEEIIPEKAQVIFHNGISDEVYNELLSSATALATASTAEGFGLPIIEAQSQSVPVICSDIEVFHEVAGSAGLFFKTNLPEGFAESVKTLENLKVRKELIKKGLEHSVKFNWQNSAKNLKEAMDKLVN